MAGTEGGLIHDLAAAPVATGIRPCLKCLMVGGKTIVEDGEILGLDVRALRARVRAAVALLASDSSHAW